MKIKEEVYKHLAVNGNNGIQQATRKEKVRKGCYRRESTIFKIELNSGILIQAIDTLVSHNSSHLKLQH